MSRPTHVGEVVGFRPTPEAKQAIIAIVQAQHEQGHWRGNMSTAIVAALVHYAAVLAQAGRVAGVAG
jgi:hypothetical protein